jgi:hypothetical protein
MKLLLTVLLLLTPIPYQATQEELSTAAMCDELLIELAIAVDNGLLTHTESEEIAEGCAILI